MRALYRFYTDRVRALGYWFVRVALLLCVTLALWIVGWKHWTVIVGALVLSEMIAYASFGAQYDPLARWVGRRFDERFPPHGDPDSMDA